MPFLSLFGALPPRRSLGHYRQEQLAAFLLILGIALIGLVLTVEWLLIPTTRGTFPSA